ncbi:MAG: hypothetical protein JSU00_04400 [Acidobacteria bacterium]|nr:hypothetical protein [Acidobacteriota bacterium]
MKMRIQGDAIRFRLNRREVEAFAESGRASGSLAFPGGGALVYTLERSAAPDVTARFEGGAIRVGVPASALTGWASTDQVGIHVQVESLEVIIEKDFQCLHKGEAGKDPDAYPNPMA